MDKDGFLGPDKIHLCTNILHRLTNEACLDIKAACISYRFLTVTGALLIVHNIR